VSLRSGSIVDLASNVPTLAPLFDRLHLRIRFRIPRYVWNVAKSWYETAFDVACRSGHSNAEADIEKTVTKAIVAIRSLSMMALR